LWITATSAYEKQTRNQPTWIIACFAVRSRKIRYMQDKQTHILRIIRSGRQAVVGENLAYQKPTQKAYFAFCVGFSATLFCFAKREWTLAI